MRGRPSSGDIAEEGGVLSLRQPSARTTDDGVLIYLFRTENGRMEQCRSRTGGETWKSGLPVLYRAGSGNIRSEYRRTLKQPRGPLTARRMRDGSFLLLYFNNGCESATASIRAVRLANVAGQNLQGRGILHHRTTHGTRTG